MLCLVNELHKMMHKCTIDQNAATHITNLSSRDSMLTELRQIFSMYVMRRGFQDNRSYILPSSNLCGLFVRLGH